MTTPARIERELPAILGDLAMGPIPDYIDDVFVQTGRMRQRPAWTFPERWLPMADITSRQALAPRVPWRTIGVALVILALLVAGVVYVGSRQTKLPPPFGPAKNGLVTYSANGDVFTVDPLNGVVAAIVTGPETDLEPTFSADGTRIFFLRQAGDAGVRFDIVVTAADGTGLRVITPEPVWNEDNIEWSPDSTAVIVTNPLGQVLRFDASTTAPPQVIAEHVAHDVQAVRPPDAGQLIYRPEGFENSVWIVNTDGSGAHSVAAGLDPTAGGFRWSPDGAMVAFRQAIPNAPDQRRIFVMNADGSGLRRLEQDAGIWWEGDYTWSPDGELIAFNRWEGDPSTGEATIRPVGIAALAGGPVVEAGPAPSSEGAILTWAPDGTSLVSVPGPFGTAALSEPPIVYDLATGSSHQVDWPVGSAASWQRTAD